MANKPHDQQPDDQAAPAPTNSGDQTAELHDQLMRIQADFANFKRRSDEERGRITSVARTDVLLSLLPVFDNFDRAFQDVPKEVSETDWYGGIRAIKQQFEAVLEELGISRVATVGEQFDPNVHEALAHEPNDQFAANVVSEEFQAGYRQGEDVLRHARVKVSSGKATSNDKKGDTTNG